MQPAPIPPNDAERLQALAEYRLLDSPPEACFDALTKLVANLLDVPIALVSIVDADRQWFKSRYGLEAIETPRDISFCGHVVASAAPLIVADTLDDERFADNPLVTGDPKIRFYAGIPLTTSDGCVLGTLCAIDRQPRTLTVKQLELLGLVAQQVFDQLELRRTRRILQIERTKLETQRRFFELTLDLLCTADDTLHFRELNPSWEHVLGWSLAELRARPFMELVHEDDRAQTLEEAGRLLRDSSTTVHFVNRYRHKNGTWVPLSWVVATQDGVFYAAARDLTAQREREAALETSRRLLHESEFRLRTLFEAMAEGVVLQDTSGAITDCNPGAARILGLSAEQLLGRSSTDPRWRCTKEDGTPWTGETHPAMITVRTGQPQSNVIMSVYKPDGEHAWISINTQPLNSTTTTGLFEVISTFRDITQQVLAERQVRSAQARLRAIIDTAIDAIVTIDEHGRIERVNPAVTRLLGYQSHELMGRNVNMLMPSPDSERHDSYLRNYLRTGEARVIGVGREVVAKRKDGSLFSAELSVSEFSIEGERRFTGMLRDITERKAVENLQSEFVSTVSHELRTPLTAIRGALGLIAAGATGALLPETREYVDIAASNSERLMRLINDLLDIEKVQSGRMVFEMQPTELRAVVTAAVSANRALTASNAARLTMPRALDPGFVSADPDRLGQVLANLLSNAVKFSPPGSCVEIGVERVEERMRVSVRDHGPGIPDEFHSRIFQRFAQADGSSTRSKGGTGLGLSISRAIVERLGGTIGFSPAPGGGTVFFFDLPYLAADASASIVGVS